MLRDKSLLVSAVLLVLAMLPLFAFTLYFAADNLAFTTGEIPSEWKEFDSPTYAEFLVQDKLSLAYWTQYGQMLLQSFPLQFFGMILWVAMIRIRKPSSAELLLLTCVLVTYIGFSWLAVKGHRYTLYMMIPASVLSVLAVRDLFKLALPRWPLSQKLTPVVLLTLIVVQGLFVPPFAPYYYLSGMESPVTHILSQKADAKILYSGRNDAAFVFYVRSQDQARLTSLHRASVQVATPDELRSYVEDNGIEYIVLEYENPGYDSLEVIDEFRVAILEFAAANSEFSEYDQFTLPYGASKKEGVATINVYRRR